MNDKNKKIITLLMVFTIVFTVIGSTLAYWNWETTEGELTGVTFTVTSDFSCSADGGDELNSNSVMLAPTTCDNETYAIKREITLDRTMGINGMKIYTDLWLDVKTLDTGLKNSDNFKWVFTQDENSCSEDNAISYGTFKDLETNDKVMLLDSKMYADTEEDTYYLYIWLDKAETSRDTMDQNFEFKLNGECTDLNQPEPPNVYTGLIPVILSNSTDNGYKVIATTSSDPNWYNYDNKEWANAVLVKETGTKTRIENSVAGTEINTNDILAYFVWIPRYAYKIWTTDSTMTTSPQEIKIMWEKGDSEYSNGLEVDEYRTQPAFWWDENGDRTIDNGETLSGIWVGKFETSKGTSSDVGTTNPLILPGKTPWSNINVSSQFKTSLLFSGGTMSNNVTSYKGSTTTYGLLSDVESHMMKNSEWGAVVYLSHSIYGINGEIQINSAGYTGGTSYGNETNLQSTTGNITGIYDMAGGKYEYVMGNYAKETGWNDTYTSGFSSSWFNVVSNQKYYDLYPEGTTLKNCNIEICGGHALFETAGWYGGYSGFVDIRPWFTRGGYHTGEGVGAFGSDRYDGYGYSSFGFRSVLSQ